MWRHRFGSRSELSIDVTKITGGDIDPLEGSGTLTVKAPADAVAPVSPSGHTGYTLILEYTAPTPREGVTLTITRPDQNLTADEFPLVAADISGSRSGIEDADVDDRNRWHHYVD